MIETIHDAERFSKLRAEWDDLLHASASDSPFLTWEWLFIWWRHLGGPRRLSIVTVRSGGDLVAIAPLTLRPPQFGRLRPSYCLEFLGAGTGGSNALDVIVRRGEEDRTLPILADYLAQGRIMLELGPARGGDSLAGRLADRIQGRGWTVNRTRTAVCPYISVDGPTWDSYFATLGSSHRAHYRRRLQGVSKRHDLRFAPATTEDERRRSLGHLIEMSDRRGMELGGSEAFYLPGLAAFHDEFGALALQRGWLRLFLLTLGPSPAAAVYGLHYGRKFHLYQAAIASPFRRNGVGLVATGLAIRSAIEGGAEEVDLLHGDESQRFRWTRRARDLVRIEVHPPGASRTLRGSTHTGREARVAPGPAGPTAAPDLPRPAIAGAPLSGTS